MDFDKSQSGDETSEKPISQKAPPGAVALAMSGAKPYHVVMKAV